MSTDPAAPPALPGPPQSLNRQGTVVASMTLLSRISGFVRDMVLAHFFGATAVADAFFVAFRIPNFFRRIAAEGAFSQAFIPVLAAVRAQAPRPELILFVQATGGWLLLALTLVCLLGSAAADALVMIFAPGFRGDAERALLAADLLRVTFPYLAFISMVAFAAALLNAHQRFAVPAVTPLLLNLGLIAAALWATPLFAEPVMALAWGVLAAGVLQLLVQLPALGRIDMLHRPKLVRHDGVRRVGRLMVPAVFAASVSQINALVDSILASFLITGSISWLYYADRLMELPVGLVAIALATVLLPSLSRLHAGGAADAFSRALEWGLRIGLVFGVPAALALYLLAVPLVATMFQRGAMTATDTLMAALALQAFSVGVAAMVVAKIAAPAYFARHDTTTPFRIALVSVAVNIVLNLALVGWMGHVGLALATSGAVLVQAFLLLRGLIQRGAWRPGQALYGFLARLAVAAAAMAGAVSWYAAPDAAWLDMTTATRVQKLAVVCSLGGGVYVVVLLVLGMRPRDLRQHA